MNWKKEQLITMKHTKNMKNMNQKFYFKLHALHCLYGKDKYKVNQ